MTGPSSDRTAARQPAGRLPAMAASRADGMQSLNRRHLSDAAGSGLFDAYKCTAIILVGLRGFEPGTGRL